MRLKIRNFLFHYWGKFKISYIIKFFYTFILYHTHTVDSLLTWIGLSGLQINRQVKRYSFRCNLLCWCCIEIITSTTVKKSHREFYQIKKKNQQNGEDLTEDDDSTDWWNDVMSQKRNKKFHKNGLKVMKKNHILMSEAF